MSAFDGTNFSGTYPISFIMRDAHPELWFRIHSLPESKRYPETDGDWNTLVDRHREIANRVLEEGSPCRINYSIFIDEGFPSELSPFLDWGEVRAVPFGDEEEVFSYTAETYWNYDIFLPWIKLRAVDQLGWISFHSLVTDSIYSPYDGGADIFSSNNEFIDNIRGTFSGWKSERPKGL